MITKSNAAVVFEFIESSVLGVRTPISVSVLFKLRGTSDQRANPRRGLGSVLRHETQKPASHGEYRQFAGHRLHIPCCLDEAGASRVTKKIAGLENYPGPR